jgi:superfamily II DNA/RNA helicase
MLLPLPDVLRTALTDAGFSTPTPVQELAIPALLQRGDVVVEAPTGSGKTLAFVLPLLAGLAERPGPPTRPVALIVTPTRELALQIAKTLKQFGRSLPHPTRAVVLIGGESIDHQVAALDRGADVVVATPGRLLDQLEREALDLSEAHTLVLDEADRLLDVAFSESLAIVEAALPVDVSTWLFSATLPGRVLARAGSVLEAPVVLRVTPKPVPVETVQQRVFAVPAVRRRLLLQTLLEEEAWGPTLVFAASKHKANVLAGKLYKAGVSADVLHGGLDQTTRNDVLRRFDRRGVNVLVATDLAARGIDLPNLEVVVNFDLPRSPSDYLHRVGRAGRAGRTGRAVTFIDHDSAAHFALIEKRNALTLERLSREGFALSEPPPVREKGAGGIKGKRKNKKDKLREAAARALKGRES